MQENGWDQLEHFNHSPKHAQENTTENIGRDSKSTKYKEQGAKGKGQNS